MITADTVTDDQIKALASEAAEAGDSKQYDLCMLALGRSTRIAWNKTPYCARGDCAAVIAKAEKMQLDKMLDWMGF